MGEKRIIIFECVVTAMAFTFLLILLNRILLPFYQSVFEKDLMLEIVATGEQNADAVGNNVRVSAISINGKTVDLSQIELSGNWAYLKTDDFLYAYSTETEDALDIALSDVITLEVSLVSEIGSGVAELNIDGQLWNSVDLYSDSDWSIFTFRYDSNPLVHPEEHAAVYVILFALSFSILYLLYRKKTVQKQMDLLRFAKRILLLAGLALVVYINICAIQFSSVGQWLYFLESGYLVVLDGYILIFLLFLILDTLIRRIWISFSVLAFVLEFLTMVSNAKLAARGTPLLPWDFGMINEALSVANGYSFTVSSSTVIVLAETVLIVAILCRFRKHNPWAGSVRPLPIWAGAAAVVLIVFVQSTVYSDIWNDTESSRVYQVGQYYAEKGFVVAFTEYTRYLFPQDEPEGYSKRTIDTLVNTIVSESDYEEETETVESSKTPNIIVIMSESFWDINRLEHVHFLEEPLPVFSSLQQESVYGNLLSHVFGGNTVVSEFEVLTGFNGAFFPIDYMVYGGFLQDGFPSAVSVLEEQGYHTLALHPYVASNYNRNVAYDCLGFDRSIFEDDFAEDVDRKRNYISDQALYERVELEFEKEKAESDDPVFLLAVTVQNHGGYWEDTLVEEAQVAFTADGYDSDTVECMNDYFAGLHASDQALGDLISYFRNVDEETIVVFFGDHMSDAGTKYETMLSKESWYGADTVDSEYEAHLVPFLIWSNKSIASENLGLLEMNQLMPIVFEQSNIKMPYFWKFLLSSREQYSAASNLVVVNPDLSVISASDMSDEQKSVRSDYQLLQYDYIWGSKYGTGLWQIP